MGGSIVAVLRNHDDVSKNKIDYRALVFEEKKRKKRKEKKKKLGYFMKPETLFTQYTNTIVGETVIACICAALRCVVHISLPKALNTKICK